jgi:uncharacterized protein YdhG (YjbR/CyaY superfamily)
MRSHDRRAFALPGRADRRVCALMLWAVATLGGGAEFWVGPGELSSIWDIGAECERWPAETVQDLCCGPLLVRLIDHQNRAVSAEEIDEYLDAVEEPKRTTLARLRQTILAIIPEAEQGISYGVPAFKVGGKTIAGFAAFKNHLSYLPHSGSVFPQLSDELRGYSSSSGALHFSIDEPLPAPLVEKLIAVRLQQAFPG